MCQLVVLGTLAISIVLMNKKKFKGKQKPKKNGNAGRRGVTNKDKAKIMIAVNQKVIRIPKPPRMIFRLRQLASTFTDQSGLSNLGGNVAATLIQAGSTLIAFSVGFELSDLAQVATWQAVFDQYKIEKVLLRFRARNNAVSVFNTASPNGGVPTGYVVIDRDDSTALASVLAAEEYDTCETFEGTDSITIVLEPSITPAYYASGAFSAYGVTTPKWLDIANPGVPHYGVKGVIGGLTVTTTSAWVWDISAEYIVAFKNVR